MVSWRLHLTNYTIEHLNILPGSPALLAVWSRRDRIAFYHLETGVALGETILDAPPFAEESSPEWVTFLSTLHAPNRAALPQVMTSDVVIYSSENGKTRLYHWGDNTLEWMEESTRKTLDSRDARIFTIAGLDTTGDLAAAVDQTGRLYLYRPDQEVIILETSMSPVANLKIARGGSAIFARDEHQIVVFDGDGALKGMLNVYYTIGQMTCSPDGKRLAVSDNDSGVLRIYDGETLKQTHQRFAVDLLEEAKQVQLIADLPPALVALSALALNDDGVLAFGVSGFICVSHVDSMDALSL